MFPWIHGNICALENFFLICYKDKEVLQLSLQVLHEAEADKAKLRLRGFFFCTLYVKAEFKGQICANINISELLYTAMLPYIISD